ncbi:hypothetical protein [Alteribacillus iranensis]|uniref:Similar to spore coat protein n=1 Tax=Alteribacillus iranensis TaxID=930128 RepID=A0A1I2EXQ8_9BACI|nr:hypothetical protein [Alteribacillus iranensis]SFE97236.1 similar to spore coat protein [Alteribacillus iranensis]
MSDKLALHERLELHEILTFKNLNLTKSSTMRGLVGCKELKGILENEVKEGQQHVTQLHELLQRRDTTS